MGLMFTPLSTISLSGVPREKMAQASGIFNIIRQLGGSFGVAILATVLSSRISYHTQMYAQSVDVNSPLYKNVTSNVIYHAENQAGLNKSNATAVSRVFMVSQITKEAYIQAIDDDFLIAAFITLIGGVPVILLRARKKKIPQNIPIQHE